jgi:hypothetical protein
MPVKFCQRSPDVGSFLVIELPLPRPQRSRDIKRGIQLGRSSLL